MKITPWLTHPQAIGVYDFLLSDKYNQSYINKCPSSSEVYNGSEWGLIFNFEAQKTASIHHKKCSTWLHMVNKGLLKWIDAFV